MEDHEGGLDSGNGEWFVKAVVKLGCVWGCVVVDLVVEYIHWLRMKHGYGGGSLQQCTPDEKGCSWPGIAEGPRPSVTN